MKRKFAWDMAKRRQSKRRRLNTSVATTVRRGGITRTFVARSAGTPLAITERKYFDAEKTLTAFQSGQSSAASGEFDPGTLNTIFAPQTGDDYNLRNGRKVQVVQIKIRGLIGYAIQADQAAADVTPFVRILLVQDRQTNAAQLNSEDVIASSGTLGFQNPAFFGRFKVLKDKYYRVPQPMLVYDGTNLEQTGTYFPWKMNIRFKVPVTVHFNSTNGGTIADIVDNSFHVIAFDDASNMAVAGRYFARTTFLDI